MVERSVKVVPSTREKQPFPFPWRQRLWLRLAYLMSNFRSIVVAVIRQRNCTSTTACRFSPSVWGIGAHPQRDVSPNLSSRQFFSDFPKCWDKWSENVNPSYLDFNRKKTQQGLRIIDNLTPPRVKAELATERRVSPDSISDRKMLREKLWRDFLSDPSQWWDNRSEKVNPRYPDFKHKRTGESLWLVDRLTPSWVGAELATMAPGLLQSDIFSWNVKLRRHLASEDYQKALHLFQQMQRESMIPDKCTFVAVLNACSGLRSLEEGRRVHEQIIQIGCESEIYVANCLVDMYAKCGSIGDAWSVFNKMGQRDVVSWSAMIVGYVKCEQGLKALELFQNMHEEGVEPNTVTFMGALNACASVAALEEGKRIHERIVRRGWESDVYVATCLVDMYAKCGSIADAWSVFDKMRERNVVSWNALIGGYVKSEQGLKALELFEMMQQEEVEPNSVTFVLVLNACASVAALREGRRVHKQIIGRRYESDVYVANCLVDMYAKCGSIKDARSVFTKMQKRNVVSWNAMIGGYAMHGHFKKAIELFEHMSKETVEIDEITFICLLSACSHGGLVEEGQHYYKTMTSHYNISPTREHFACMVDLLGRAGWLEEAEAMIEEMMKRTPMERGSSVWRSLLGACRIHGNIEIAERAAKKCWEFDPKNASAHVVLSNIYAAAGKLDRSAAIDNKRLEINVWKVPGRTWINVKNVVHSFVEDDNEHPQLQQIHVGLDRLLIQLNEEAYIPDWRFLSHEIKEECQVCHQDEKLAIASENSVFLCSKRSISGFS